MVDVVEAAFNIGIEYELRFVPDGEKDRIDGIVT